MRDSIERQPSSELGMDSEAVAQLSPARTGARFLAFVLDAVGYVLTMYLWLIPLLWLHPMVAYIAMPGAWLVYLAVGWGRGRTFGMRLMRIRLQRLEDGARPGWARGAVRSVLGGTPAIAFFLLLAAGFSDPPEQGLSRLTQAVVAGAAAIFVLGLLARLTMIVDRRHMSLVDHVVGVIVVKDGPGASGHRT